MLAPASELPEEFRPLRRAKYDRLIDLGVFEGTKVQLVGGLARYRGVGKTGEALLVIEVSESSVRFDLGEKARRYAAAGYPEYWVIDCVALVLIRHTHPSPDGTWGSIERLDSGVITCVAVTDVTLDLTDLFDF